MLTPSFLLPGFLILLSFFFGLKIGKNTIVWLLSFSDSVNRRFYFKNKSRNSTKNKGSTQREENSEAHPGDGQIKFLFLAVIFVLLFIGVICLSDQNSNPSSSIASKNKPDNQEQRVSVAAAAFNDNPMNASHKTVNNDIINRPRDEVRQIYEKKKFIKPLAEEFIVKTKNGISQPVGNHPKGKFFIQVEAGSQEQAIKKAAQKWSKAYDLPVSIAIESGHKHPYKVLFGPFNTREEANKYKRHIQVKGAFTKQINQ